MLDEAVSAADGLAAEEDPDVGAVDPPTNVRTTKACIAKREPGVSALNMENMFINGVSVLIGPTEGPGTCGSCSGGMGKNPSSSDMSADVVSHLSAHLILRKVRASFSHCTLLKDILDTCLRFLLMVSATDPISPRIGFPWLGSMAEVSFPPTPNGSPGINVLVISKVNM